MIDSLKKLKRSYMWLSIGYIIIGAVFLIYPELSLMNFCYALGCLFIVYGIVHLIIYFVQDRYTAMFQSNMAIGILGVILGIIILICPKIVVSILPILLGIVIILSSIMKIQNSIDLARVHYKGWGTVLIFAIISLLLGVVLIWNPFEAAATLMRFIGAVFLVDGITSLWSILCLTLKMHKVKKEMKEAEERANMEHFSGDVITDEPEAAEEEPAAVTPAPQSTEVAPAQQSTAVTPRKWGGLLRK